MLKNIPHVQNKIRLTASEIFTVNIWSSFFLLILIKNAIKKSCYCCYQFIYGVPKKSWKPKLLNCRKYKWSWYFNKIAHLNLAKVFFCEFCEISKNTFLTEHLRTTASEVKQNEVFTIINRICIFIWYQYDVENWYHYKMKFYVVLRYRYNIVMLEKDII